MPHLHDELQRRIEELRAHGEFKLPAERELAEELGVARGTLRKALAELVDQGLIELKQGRGGGAFVRDVGQPQLAQPFGNPPFVVTRTLNQVIGVPEFLTDQGYTPGTRIINAEERPALPEQREALGLGERGMVIVLRRLRLANGVPLSLEEMVLKAELFPNFLQRDLTSVYGLMREEYGVHVNKAEEAIAVKAATPAAAYHLDIAVGSPLFDLDRVAYDSSGQPVEISRDLFRADLMRMTVATG
ncbi:GntR family transcriptional regulator [Leucobacter sp. UCMA 4100]|uniref:GntR family transcriptional regulator n=1 Tax=Leucobacter sp. UCMA 4100 TaxID=2810534 RepID=UPI0022EA2F3F|nr:GntR family transcriptional regulator [Leucobacter sp. UCMA 4100]